MSLRMVAIFMFTFAVIDTALAFMGKDRYALAAAEYFVGYGFLIIDQRLQK